MYIKTAIPKKADGAGAAVPKDPNVIVLFTEDITAEPTRSHGNVALTGNYTLKDGATAVGIYLTPSTIEAGYDAEGDVDARGFKHRVGGEHPGNDPELESFVEGTVNKGVVILVKDCDGSAKGVTKAYGSKCNPLFLTPTPTDSKDANKTALAWAQEIAGAFLPGIYSGTIPTLAGAESSEEKETA
ncbi:MAG: hypothetical protein IJ222_03425 [Bacteroidales bacterium]|nr:hypothetical protein [Bacteroidales bacterium]